MKIKRQPEGKSHMWKATALLDSDMPPLIYMVKLYDQCGVWIHQRGGELDWLEVIAETKEAALEAVERWRK